MPLKRPEMPFLALTNQLFIENRERVETSQKKLVFVQDIVTKCFMLIHTNELNLERKNLEQNALYKRNQFP